MKKYEVLQWGAGAGWIGALVLALPCWAGEGLEGGLDGTEGPVEVPPWEILLGESESDETTGSTVEPRRPEFPRLSDEIAAIGGWPPEDTGERWLAGFFRVTLAVPNLLVEGAAALFLPDRIVLNDVTLFQQGAAEGDFAALFARHFLRRESSFLSNLGTSGAIVFDPRLGREDLDPERFDAIQVKILADSFKRAYRDRFHVPALDADQVAAALSSGTWVDSLVIPAGLSLYTARFGIDRKWTFGEQDVRVHFHLERASRIYRSLTKDAHHMIGSLSIYFGDFPIGILVAADGNAGRAEIGFLGIGTDLGTVFDVLAGREAHR
jgi:hypothetical protein